MTFRRVAARLSGPAMLLSLLCLPHSALAASCPLPNTLTNGQTADATQVMADFTALKTCTEGAITPSGTPSTGSLAKFSTGNTVTTGDLTGDVTTSGSVATTIANSAVTTAKINDAAVSLPKIANAAASGKLLGSGSSGAGGSYSEITLGSGLSMSGTTLSATGGGGTYEATGTVPLIGNFTWVNQGTVTATNYAKGIIVSSNTALGNFRLLMLTPGAGAWDFYVRWQRNGHVATNDQMGLVVRNSTNGRLEYYGEFNGNMLQQRWTNVSTYSSNITGTPSVTNNLPWWWRVSYDGSNTLTYMYSRDGCQWQTANTSSVSAFLTAAGGGSADTVGFGLTPTANNDMLVQYASLIAPTC